MNPRLRRRRREGRREAGAPWRGGGRGNDRGLQVQKGTGWPSDHAGLRGGLQRQAQLRPAAKLRRFQGPPSPRTPPKDSPKTPLPKDSPSQGLPFSRTPLPKYSPRSLLPKDPPSQGLPKDPPSQGPPQGLPKDPPSQGLPKDSLSQGPPSQGPPSQGAPQGPLPQGAGRGRHWAPLQAATGPPFTEKPKCLVF